MEKIAIISPLVLPVSEVKGGAVEQLILNIIEENEKSQTPLKIDLYSMYSEQVRCNYKNTKVYLIKKNIIETIFQKVINLGNKILKRKYRYDTYIRKAVKLVNKNNYDKIIIENRMGLYKEIYNKTQNKNNLIYHMHNDFDEFDKTPENYLFIEKTCFKILTVSNYINERLQQIKKSNKIVTYYNCIDQNKFDKKNIIKNELDRLKKNYKINEKDFVIGFVGRVTEEKGIYELVLSFKEFVKNHKTAKLMIVGSSWFDKEKLTSFEKKLVDLTNDIKDNVIFTGYINYDKINYIYQMFNVLVIPSKCQESFGLVALEGIANNIPVIATGNGGLKEVLPKECICITNENMVDDINNALLKMYKENKNIFNGKFPNKFTKETYYKNFIKYIK